MGKLPTVQGVRQIAQPTRGVAAISPGSAGAVGRAMEGLGGTVSAIGDVIFERETTAMATDRDVMASEEIRDLLYNPETGFASMKGQGAVGAREQTIEKLEALKSKAYKGLNGTAKRKLESSLQRRIDGAMGTIERHTLGERDSWLVMSDAARRENAYQDAAVNPAETAASLKIIEDTTRAEGARLGWGEEVIEARLRTESTRVYSANIESLAANDPNEAFTYLRANQSKMDGAEVDRLKAVVEIARVQADPMLAKTYTGEITAHDLIRPLEGFRDSAYWDVNAQRVGYGSDTKTNEDGSVEKVTKTTVVTRRDAERDLSRRVKEFQSGASAKVGPEVWNGLPKNVQASLTSIAYNYGELPDRIIPAVQSGDAREIATAVLGLASDNDGVNSKRRKREAEVILGGAIDLTFGAKSAAVSAAVTKLTSDAVALKSENSLVLAQLGVGVKAGTVTFDDINASHQNNEITNAQWGSLTEELIVSNRQLERDSAAMNALIEDTAAGNQVSGQSIDTRRAVDLVDDELVATIEDEEDLKQTRLAVVEQIGVASKKHVEDLLGGMDRGSPEAFEQASQVTQVAKNAFVGVPKGAELTKRLDEYKAYTSVGFSAEDAARRTSPTKQEETLNKPTNDEVNKELKEFSVKKISSALETYLPGDELGFTPKMEARASNDYGILYRAARIDGMPAKVAEQHAINRMTDPINGLYGESNFASGSFSPEAKKTGRVAGLTAIGMSLGLASHQQIEDAKTTVSSGIMRLPLEKHYPTIDGGHDYITNDIHFTLQGIEGWDGGDWAMVPDESETDAAIRLSQRGENILPGYLLMYTDDRGAPQTKYWRMEPEEIAALRDEGREEQSKLLVKQLEDVRNLDPQGIQIQPKGASLPGDTLLERFKEQY